MKLSQHTKLTAIALASVIGLTTLLAGRGLGGGQDALAKGVRPQVREAALGIAGIMQQGITRGQTLRIDHVALLGLAGCDDHPMMKLTIMDSGGGVLAVHDFASNQNLALDADHFDLNADQLPQEEFDAAGRAELTAVVTSAAGVGPGGGCIVSGEVFSNNTGATLVHVASVPLFACGGAGPHV